MDKIYVVYWSQTGNTEAMAEAVARGIRSEGKESAVVEVGSISPEELKEEAVFALGCPAMGRKCWKNQRWSLLWKHWKHL